MSRAEDGRLLLAVDAGTTNIKAALVDLDGRILDKETVGATVLMPFPGACEMDMEAVWQGLCGAVLALRERNRPIWARIAAVGICAQGDGAWPLDGQGRPVGNAMLWNDTRVHTDFSGINRRCIELDTTPLFPGAAPVLLGWVKAREPERYRRIRHVLHCKDWLNYRLTGVICTEATDASTATMNIFTKRYVQEVLDMAGVPESLGLFPPVRSSSDIIGGTLRAPSELLGLKEGTPVICGAIDVLSVVTGCGLAASGQCGSIAGTTMGNIVVIGADEAKKYLGNVGSVLCHTAPDTYIRQMSGLSGASALDWVQHEIMGDEPYRTMEPKLAELPTGCDGLIFHPYLYGERAPFALASACGGFYGLRAFHTKYHMARAAFEGMALSMYDCYQSLPPCGDLLTLAGGASKSDFVCQLVSNCMGKTVLRRKESELGIRGVYCMLATALGCSIAQTGEDRRFVPDAAEHAKYLELYRPFRALREQMEPFWKSQRTAEP